ncbi:MAG: methyltransferase domain-containing protein [Rhodocyclaceae bacterium]|nr:methyltransferase domain-containing protein [Rhodocyclaceae bacterium]
MTLVKRQTEVGGSENLDAMLAAENYNAFLVSQLRRHLAGCRQVLDFGAGNGFFAERMQKQGFKVVAVEPEPDLGVRIGALGIPCVRSLEGVPAQSMDGAYSLNVLEHIEDDAEALSYLYDVLVPGGVLYLYVPAFAILFSAMDRCVGHVRRYRLAELRQKCFRAGFILEAGAYADSVGYAASLALKVFGSPDGSLDPGSVRLYDRFAFPVSRQLDRLCSSFVGKNVWVRVRRPLRSN